MKPQAPIKLAIPHKLPVRRQGRLYVIREIPKKGAYKRVEKHRARQFQD